VNVEEGESKQQLLQIRELSFGQYEVFVCVFWEGRFKFFFDGKDIEWLVTDWFIKEQCSHPHARMKGLAGQLQGISPM
jgi:hypothetical protein